VLLSFKTLSHLMADGRKDGRTDLAKLIVAFAILRTPLKSFVTSEMSLYYVCSCKVRNILELYGINKII